MAEWVEHYGNSSIGEGERISTMGKSRGEVSSYNFSRILCYFLNIVIMFYSTYLIMYIGKIYCGVD